MALPSPRADGLVLWQTKGQYYSMLMHYILKRILLIIPVLLAVIFITYTFAIYGPGDPILTIVGQTEAQNDEELIARLRHQHGYDRPLLIQYGDYVTDFMTGEWGTSYQVAQQSVQSLVFRTLPISLQLGLVSVLILIFVGIPLGVLAALKKNTWIDHVIVGLAVFGNSIPAFVLAPVLLVFFVLTTGLIDSSVGWDGVFSTKVILPAVTLALGPMVLIVRQTRYAVIEVLEEDFIRTARAKGLDRKAIIWRHVLRNSMQPVITLTGLIAASLVTGSIFVEQIFGIPGFGQLVYAGLRYNDLPLLMATTIIGGVIVMLSNLLVDITYVFLDPRVKYA